jgi:hypothetical protein
MKKDGFFKITKILRRLGQNTAYIFRNYRWKKGILASNVMVVEYELLILNVGAANTPSRW